VVSSSGGAGQWLVADQTHRALTWQRVSVRTAWARLLPSARFLSPSWRDSGQQLMLVDSRAVERPVEDDAVETVVVISLGRIRWNPTGRAPGEPGQSVGRVPKKLMSLPVAPQSAR
jgi:hypothetical protein